VVIAYGVAVGNWDRYHQFVAPRIPAGRPVTVQYGHPSITVAYNHILDSWARRDGLDALVLLHEDLEMIDPETESKILAALADQDVAFVGIAGGRGGPPSLAWWESPERFGHQFTDSGVLELGPHTGEVTLLEGSFLVFSPWAVKNLRYDERMTGFHCCDEIVIRAQHHGKRAVVADIATHHHTIVGAFKSEAAQQEWYINETIYRKREKL
jgi:hypothetical protein